MNAIHLLKCTTPNFQIKNWEKSCRGCKCLRINPVRISCTTAKTYNSSLQYNYNIVQECIGNTINKQHTCSHKLQTQQESLPVTVQPDTASIHLQSALSMGRQCRESSALNNKHNKDRPRRQVHANLERLSIVFHRGALQVLNILLDGNRLLGEIFTHHVLRLFTVPNH